MAHTLHACRGLLGSNGGLHVSGSTQRLDARGAVIALHGSQPMHLSKKHFSSIHDLDPIDPSWQYVMLQGSAQPIPEHGFIASSFASSRPGRAKAATRGSME